MIPILPLRKSFRKGGSTLEAVIGILLVSIIVVVIAHNYANIVHSLAQIQKQKKAALLAQMVFEQYNSYARLNFRELADHDVEKVGAKAFLQADLSGFEPMIITSKAVYATDRLSCDVTVTLTWSLGGQEKSATFTKAYFEKTPLLSGPATQVWVKAPCNALDPDTQMDQIIAQCPGLLNFEVTAPSSLTGNINIIGTSDAYGKTDSRGLATLRNVATGNITITVRKRDASPYNVPSDDPSFVQGYYAVGTTNTSFAKAATIPEKGQATILFTEFRPLSHIRGSLINTSPMVPKQGSAPGDLPAGGPVDNMEIAFIGPSGAQAYYGSGLTTAISNNTFIVKTDARGVYGFSNVLPPGTWTMQINGRKGSDDKTICWWDAGFEWGYANYETATVSLSPNTGVAGDVQEIAQMPIQRMGWVYLRTWDSSSSGDQLAGVTLSIRFPPTRHNAIYEDTFQTYGMGVRLLFNVFSLNNPNSQNMLISAFRTPVGGDKGFYKRYWWWNTAAEPGKVNFCEMRLDPGVPLSLKLLRAPPNYPNPTKAGLKVGIGWWTDMMGCIVGTKQDAGETMTWSFDEAMASDNLMLQVNSGEDVYATISGRMFLRGTSTPVEGLSVSGLAGAGSVYDVTPSKSDGWYQFKVKVSYLEYFSDIGVQCASHDCAVNRCTNYDSSPCPPLLVRDDQSTIVPRGSKPPAYELQGNQIAITNGANITQNLDVDLVQYRVSGTVTEDVSNNPVPGITVMDVAGGGTTTTDASGQYGISAPFWCKVTAGTVRVKAVENASYYEGLGTDVPISETPNSPVISNLSVSPKGGGGGGGV